MFDRSDHAIVLITGTIALASTPATGGPVYWATLIPAVYGTLYGLVYAANRTVSEAKRVVSNGLDG